MPGVCPSLSPGFAQIHVYWVSDAIYLILCPFFTPFSFCLQSFPGSGSFPMSWLFPSGGQSIGASASVLPVKIQGWFPLGLTGLISLQSKGLSRVFNTTVQKHQFFSAQLSSQVNSHIHTWLLEKLALTLQTFVSKVMSLLFNMLSSFVIASHHPRWLESKSPLPLSPLVLKRSKAWNPVIQFHLCLCPCIQSVRFHT